MSVSLVWETERTTKLMTIDFTIQPKWSKEGIGQGIGATQVGNSAFFDSGAITVDDEIVTVQVTVAANNNDVVNLSSEKSYRVQITEVP